MTTARTDRPHAPAPVRPGLRRHNPATSAVPRRLTSLIGRGREVVAVAGLVGRTDVRLVTLTGPGGVGKTRLALRVAAELAPAFLGGVVVVPLASIGDPAQVASSIAQYLGIRDATNRPLVERLKAELCQADGLLFLDNFDPLVEAASLLIDLLGACPGLRLMVASRTLFRLSGEHGFPVPPLALPDPPGSVPPPLERVAGVEAVRLFVERARAIEPAFALTETNAPAVAELCRRLDGLPLAIELAAARANLLPPEAMLTRLARRLPVLTGGARDVPERLRTMRAAIAWSYHLLNADEQALFRRVAVFAGGFTPEAAEVVGAGGALTEGGGAAPGRARPMAPSVLDLLGSLVDHSLVQRVEPGGADTAPGGARLRMLETIREFGLEHLEESGEALAVHRRHADHLLALAERAYRGIHARDGAGWLDRLEVEHDNLRAALRWWLDQGDGEQSLRLAVAPALFWRDRGHLGEGLGWLEQALAASAGRSSALRAEALDLAGDLAWIRGDHERALARFEASLAEAQAIGDAIGLARGRFRLGGVALHRGELERAAALLGEALASFRANGDAGGARRCWSTWGWWRGRRGTSSGRRPAWRRR